ncbi:superinfection immunity protein [Aquipuribacter sp. SD81]|uniref:superinfection immunity protein n=1 Tax=Aquipuribacter sp. SD81 TaxID=3127703 RepID=UPI0030161B9D
MNDVARGGSGNEDADRFDPYTDAVPSGPQSADRDRHPDSPDTVEMPRPSFDDRVIEGPVVSEGYHPGPAAPPAPPAPAPAAGPVVPVPQPLPAVRTAQGVAPYRPRVGGGHIAIAWVITVLTLGYMLPWAIAATRQRSNVGAIALLNVLVGWTFIGWVAALVMSCMSDPVATLAAPTYVQVNVPVAPPAPAWAPGWYPDGQGDVRYFDGRAWTSHVQ